MHGQRNIKTFLMCSSKAQDVPSVTHTHRNQTELPQLFRTKFPISITTQSRVRNILMFGVDAKSTSPVFPLST